MFVYIIYFLILLSLFNLPILLWSFNETFIDDRSYAEKIANDIRQQLGSSNIDQPLSESVCIDDKSSKKGTMDFIKYLRDDLLKTRYEVIDLKQKLKQKENNCYDTKRKIDADKAKQQLVQSISDDASLLSGLSSAEAAHQLNDHYNKPLTMDSFEKELQNQKPMSPVVIIQNNEKNSSKMDDFLKKKRVNKVDKIKDNYLMSNMIKVDCPIGETPDEETSLGDILFQLANDFGFNDSKCKNGDKECQTKFLKNARDRGLSALNNLTGIFGCQVKNTNNGLFPANLKDFNQS